MKVTRFTLLSIVITCLLGSVWADVDLYSTSVSKDFCRALLAGKSSTMYFSAIKEEELGRFSALASPNIVPEDLNELPPEDIAAAAKVFLFDKKFLSLKIDQGEVLQAFENPSELGRYKYFMRVIIKTGTFTIPLESLQETKRSIRNYSSARTGFFKLSTENPVQAMAAYFLEQCFIS
ncbi:hypothetical protein IWQ61_008969 [Dispira simplex]|nr:hypothetical protein IWQ61_008969 [Dispira simplex]